MCVEGPGFKSDERVDSGLPHQNKPEHTRKIMRKEIRFECSYDEGMNWPSQNWSFLNNPNLTDNFVVMQRGHKTSLLFQGANCVPWTQQQCQAHAQVVAHALGLVPQSMAKNKAGKRPAVHETLSRKQRLTLRERS